MIDWFSDHRFHRLSMPGRISWPLFTSKIMTLNSISLKGDCLCNICRYDLIQQFSFSMILRVHAVLVDSIFISWLQHVSQYPDGTSIWTLKTKTQFLRRPFQLSVNKVFQMKAEHFCFKMKVLASLKLAKQSQKTTFCLGE